jgi:hypothetical protein
MTERFDDDGDRVVTTRRERHLSDELGDLGSVLFFDHRREVAVVAEEELGVLARATSSAVSPGRFGIGGDAVVARGVGEALDVGPVERERGGDVLVDSRHRGLDNRLDQATEARARPAVGLGLSKHPCEEVVEVLGLAIREEMHPVLVPDEHPEAPSVGVGEADERAMHAREMRRTPVTETTADPKEEGPHQKLTGPHPDWERRLDPGDLGREAIVVENRLEAGEVAQHRPPKRRPPRSATASGSLRLGRWLTRSPRRWEQVIPAASMNARNPIASAIATR